MWADKAVFVICIFSLTTVDMSLVTKLKTAFRWKKIDFMPSSFEECRKFDTSKAVPYDFERAKDGRTFMTLIAKRNFPVSLTTISRRHGEDNPLLTPYPDSTWFSNPLDCNNITGAWSIKIDKCNRLWVLDTGHIENLQVCDPKLLVFNLTDNELLNKYIIPEEMYSNSLNKSVLVNPIIETEGSSCKVKNLYMADSQGYGLIMWNGEKFLRIEGPEFGAEVASTLFNISGTTFSFAGGIVPMDSNPISQTLFFAPMASRNLLTLNKSGLNGMFDGGPKPDFHGKRDILKVQPSSFRLSTDGKILFMGLVDNSIRCWHVEKKYNDQNIDTVIVDNEKLQFISSIKIYPRKNQDGDEMWILTNSLQKTINKIRNFDEINYRILHISIKNLVKNTHCE